MGQSRPKVKRSRALGIALTPKCVAYFERRPFPPGQHGRARRQTSDYKSPRPPGRTRRPPRVRTWMSIFPG